MAKLEPSNKQLPRTLAYLKPGELEQLVEQLVDPRMSRKSGHSDDQAVILDLISSCGVVPVEVQPVRRDFSSVVERSNRPAYAAQLIPMLALTAYFVRPLTVAQQQKQEDYLPDELDQIAQQLAIDPVRAGVLVMSIAQATAHEDNHVDERNPVNHPMKYRRHMNGVGRYSFPDERNYDRIVDWYEHHIIAGVHMALALRQIAINPAPAAQRQQAIQLWKETRPLPQLARVEDLIAGLEKCVETIVAGKTNELDRLLKAAPRLDVLSHRNRRIQLRPFYC